MHLDAGRLIALNVFVSDASNLAEPSYVERFFRALIGRIHMKPLTAPMSIIVPSEPTSVDDEHADDGGMTTQCIISTSHIAYHSWPLQQRFRLVVDSCKDFTASSVRSSVHEWFAVKGISVQDVPYLAPEVRDHAEDAEKEPDEEALCIEPPV